MIAYGVVLVRDTGMPTVVALSIRDQLNRGELIGPEMIVTPGIFVDRIVAVAEPAQESALVAAGRTYR